MALLCARLWRVDCVMRRVWGVDRVTTWLCDELTGSWTDDGIGLLHVIRLRYSIFSGGGQTSTLSQKHDDEPHNDGQLNVSHRLSRRLNNATGQCSVVCPSHVDNDRTVASGVLTSRCPVVVCPVVPSLFRPTAPTFRCILPVATPARPYFTKCPKATHFVIFDIVCQPLN